MAVVDFNVRDAWPRGRFFETRIKGKGVIFRTIMTRQILGRDTQTPPVPSPCARERQPVRNLSMPRACAALRVNEG